ncbi:type I secretion system ATPase, LssB family LapB [Desulfocucumis palustris]|uniref:Type I secretion system ATPase, LssB family LapB n=2 Tax=Desulfocucumis palustris TaxID=1898651 RepID=A0A2L2XIF1_9FIRM|nr:NHLP family bacteriocin export ABC transporter peptidase/permease/ATPase subunit [Desulfocucumis palustris]GBF35764.1 type I secretion system ATPase, LssB family LapB [Desulfocucumis palustris]
MREKRTKRVKVPTVLQMEAVECGAAALAMILAYHGKYVPLEEMRVACGVTRDGSKASNILKAARRYGLEAKGYRKEPGALKEMELPVIIHWNFNHFLVLEGFNRGNALLNDPVCGPRTVSEEEFDQSFTGIVLAFEVGPGFEKNGGKPSIAVALWRRLKGSERALAYVILLGLALVIPGLVIPVFSKIFVDDILLGGKGNWLAPLLTGMFLTAVLRGVLTRLQKYYLLRLETKIALSTSAQFLWHVLRLPAEFFTQRHAGDVSLRVQSNDRVAGLLSGQLAANALNFIMIIFYLALMAQYSLLLALVGVLAAAANLLYLRYVSRLRVDLNYRLLQDVGKLKGASMSGLQLIETLKATGSESDFFAKWSGYQAKVLNSEQEMGVTTQYLSAIPSFLTMLVNAVVLVLGGFLIFRGEMTIGMLVAFQSLMSSFLEPVNGLVSLGSQLQEMEGDMNRLDDVMRYPADARMREDQPDGSGLELRKLEGYLELKNLTFGYSRLEPPLIEDFSLKLAPGARVALVGGSGSGKSTVAKLVSGIYRPWSGEILFDGKPWEITPRAVINNSLGLVDQDISLFQGTIRDNLTLWDNTVSEFDIVRAAKDACIHDDITAKAGGYDHLLDEGGSNFSGGQRQRLEIARALTGNPSLLILDEATSALDPLTEKLVDEGIRRRGCTCLIVAHRLSTIRDCDEIVVLERGKIVQRGTHDQLKDIDGLYAELIKAG